MAKGLVVAVMKHGMPALVIPPDASQPCSQRRSGSEAEMHHVAVGDNVILPLEPEFARLARAGFAIAGNVIVIRDGLRTDEALLKIGVNDARRLRRTGAARDRPGARLLGAGCEIGDKVEERITGADQAVETGLRQADGGEIFGPFGG